MHSIFFLKVNIQFVIIINSNLNKSCKVLKTLRKANKKVDKKTKDKRKEEKQKYKTKKQTKRNTFKRKQNKRKRREWAQSIYANETMLVVFIKAIVFFVLFKAISISISSLLSFRILSIILYMLQQMGKIWYYAYFPAMMHNTKNRTFYKGLWIITGDCE